MEAKVEATFRLPKSCISPRFFRLGTGKEFYDWFIFPFPFPFIIIINDFATQLYRIFLKTNIFLKTEHIKLIRSEFRT